VSGRIVNERDGQTVIPVSRLGGRLGNVDEPFMVTSPETRVRVMLRALPNADKTKNAILQYRTARSNIGNISKRPDRRNLAVISRPLDVRNDPKCATTCTISSVDVPKYNV